jgi:hypothetical protein
MFCFSYLAWTFQTPASLSNQIQSSLSHNSHQKATIARHRTTQSNNKTKEQSINKKKQALSLHLHTHHHHHIHNSKISKIPLSPEKSSALVNNEQLIKTEDIAPTTENEALNFTIKHLSTDKKTTRRKSSPVKRRVNSGSKR